MYDLYSSHDPKEKGRGSIDAFVFGGDGTPPEGSHRDYRYRLCAHGAKNSARDLSKHRLDVLHVCDLFQIRRKPQLQFAHRNSRRDNVSRCVISRFFGWLVFANGKSGSVKNVVAKL